MLVRIRNLKEIFYVLNNIKVGSIEFIKDIFEITDFNLSPRY